MPSLRVIASLFAATLIALPALARDDTPPSGYPAKALLSTGTTVVGEPIVYPAGKPHVTAAIVTIAPGSKTIVHKHGVPMVAYMLQGELLVNYGADGTRTYKQGDALMEAMNVAHLGINNGAEPVHILVVYMGADGAPVGVIPEK
jgi:quercetin dioxygenase-like cupin family protein